MSLNKLLLLATFCLFSLFAVAQNTTGISGVIKDNNGPVAGVSVTLKNTNRGALTNEKGVFELTNVKPGEYVLVVSSIGYISQQKNITVQAGRSETLNLELKAASNDIQQVTVVGKTKSQEVRETGFAVNAIETKKFANTTADLNQVLSRSAGVRIREQGGLGSNFNFSINGLSGKAVKYFIDGVPLELMGTAMSLNNIPVNLAERLEVYKGVVPVQLGADAMGGAVNIITNQKTSNYLDFSHSYGSFNTNRTALTAQYGDKKTGLIFKANGFYNYSNNNYLMKGVEILEGGTRNGKQITDLSGASFVTTDIERFHDNYRSGMGQAEVGLINKSWADAIFISGAYTKANQDLQTGFDQKTVYGAVTRKSDALSGSIRYKKDNLFTKGLSLSLFGSVSKDTYITADTLLRQYYWDGSWTEKGSAEMGGIKQLSHIIRPRKFIRANTGYIINEQHSISINYTLDNLKNETYNELLTDRDYMPGRLNKQILGLAYQQEFLDKRLTNTWFVKNYNLGLGRNKYVGNVLTQLDTSFNNIGYGVASRFKINEKIGVKLSAERAYRLQEAEEMFGDGLNVQPNPDLVPESSDNVNAGAFASLNNGSHHFFIEAAGFYRNAKNFIYLVPDVRSGALKNENKSSVRVTGFEVDARYNYQDLLALSANVTYQNAINTTKFGSTESNVPEATYLNQIPNQPWLFGNADLSIGKNDLLGKNTRLQFNWFTQYVHWFYLTWENYGNTNGKSNIPTQFIHNAALTYSLENGKYNITAECRNLGDMLAYDNFKLQKPGRSFSIKFRYFIK
ncbi:TonB-dependent receptor [Mucilaginibacter pedocola]|uniref:Energy transducer TonB n=1 Tax=Mucilaginibacter pedocola TaxID=1792845 RepID=A0A1S9PCS7_9SPHI|nr:TonB-dependent receptor [Mucilaginibacter pedocola]OOQ58784.1 energy transducer TonB [Mucilaginibacter pedocola]